MKHKITLFVFLLVSIAFPEGIKDLIAPIHLTAGVQDTFLISDIFYSPDYNISLKPNASVNAQFVNGKYLIMKPAENFEGLSLLQFNLGRQSYYIPFTVQLKANYTFHFRAPDAKKVNLFGSFNSWNREIDAMKLNKDGIYEITVPLDPGLYEYKFYVDGNEFLDPLNRDSIPNGLGGYNSVISIKPFHTEKSFLHVYSRGEDKKDLLLTFWYEKQGGTSLNNSSVIALVNNSIYPASDISIDGDKIILRVPEKMRRENPVIRVAVNDKGLTTYFQTVRFFNGEIAANQDKMSSFDNVMYALMIDRFKDGDPGNSIPVVHPKLLHKANYFGGDLQGVLDEINNGYFDSLGVNTLWLSPVIDNTDSAYQEYPAPHRFYTGYHGYWPVSPTKVEERFGDMNLLKKLVSTAHQHKMKVLLDYVANHIHIEHPWWKEHRDWFGQLELPDGRKNLRLWDEYRLTTWFEPFMPKFDYIHSKAALEAMTDNALWWIKTTGVDGFRHDAVKHVPNVYWRLLTKKLKKQYLGKKYIYQIGETFGSYQLVNSYVNNGQLDAQFNFILYDTAIPTFTGNTSFTSLDEQMHKTFDVYGVNHLMGNIMDSHDKVRFMAYADNDVNDKTGDAAELGWNNPPEVDYPSSYDKLKLYVTYLASIPGIPVIYYGDEIGMTGAADPDNRRMMRFNDQLKDIEKKTLHDVSLILKQRDTQPALRYGDYLTLKADSANYAFIRSDFNERVLVVLNKSEKNQQYELKMPSEYQLSRGTDLIKGGDLPVMQNKLYINIAPLSYKIIKFNLTGNVE
jgi:cyclomaltodextrinase